MVLVLEAVGRDDLHAARDALAETLAVTARRYAHVRFAYGFATVAAGIVAHTAGRPDQALTIFAATRRHRFDLRYEGGGALADAYEARCRHALPADDAERSTRRGETLTTDALVDMSYDVAEGSGTRHGRQRKAGRLVGDVAPAALEPWTGGDRRV